MIFQHETITTKEVAVVTGDDWRRNERAQIVERPTLRCRDERNHVHLFWSRMRAALACVLHAAESILNIIENRMICTGCILYPSEKTLALQKARIIPGRRCDTKLNNRLS
jgi:hypothetical protein